MTDLTPQIVKVARVGLGLSQAEFAQRCGIGKNTLPRIERSEGRANEGTWRLIEMFLKEQQVSWSAQGGLVSIQLPAEGS
ncbi:MAG: helix-turn-helix domain-containing protein [Kordiimonas sp.]